MTNQKLNDPAIIKSCAIAFLCVCENLLEREQLQSWARDEHNPNDFMDANVVLDQIVVNYDIETFNEDGEMTDEVIDFFNKCFDMAKELNSKKHTIEAVESSYFVENLFMSINDIYQQFDGDKIDTKEAKTLARKCCIDFLVNG
jgi:hypothetical protein